MVTFYVLNGEEKINIVSIQLNVINKKKCCKKNKISIKMVQHDHTDDQYLRDIKV